LSDDAKALISKMMTPDQVERPHAKDLLNDTWFNKAPSKEFKSAVMKKYQSNLKQFNAKLLLQKVTQQYLVQNMIEKQEAEELVNVFEAFD